MVDWDDQPAFQAVFFDITERKSTEAALRESEARLAKAQRIAHLGNWVRDYFNDTLEWSDEVFRIFGHEPQAFTHMLVKATVANLLKSMPQWSWNFRSSVAINALTNASGSSSSGTKLLFSS